MCPCLLGCTGSSTACLSDSTTGRRTASWPAVCGLPARIASPQRLGECSAARCVKVKSCDGVSRMRPRKCRSLPGVPRGSRCVAGPLCCSSSCPPPALGGGVGRAESCGARAERDAPSAKETGSRGARSPSDGATRAAVVAGSGIAAGACNAGGGRSDGSATRSHEPLPNRGKPTLPGVSSGPESEAGMCVCSGETNSFCDAIALSTASEKPASLPRVGSSILCKLGGRSS